MRRPGRGPVTRRLLPFLTLVALALAGDALAGDGEDGAEVECGLEGRAGRLVARLDLRSAFPEELRRTFGNGLTNVVALHVGLLAEGSEAPAAVFGRVVEARYDVWEESFAVVVRDPQSPRGRRLVVRRWEELRALLGDARDLDLAPLGALSARSWLLRARVEVNPVSREVLEKTREYLANPPTGVRGGTPSRSVLGAMASYFLQGAGPGEALHFHSRIFTAREVAPR